MAEPIIRAENISKKFRSKSVLEDISFEVMRGEFLSLLGPSGCGKTTILRMLIGIEQPTAGRIYKNGEDITHTAPKDPFRISERSEISCTFKPNSRAAQ